MPEDLGTDRPGNGDRGGREDSQLSDVRSAQERVWDRGDNGFNSELVHLGFGLLDLASQRPSSEKEGTDPPAQGC